MCLWTGSLMNLHGFLHSFEFRVSFYQIYHRNWEQKYQFLDLNNDITDGKHKFNRLTEAYDFPPDVEAFLYLNKITKMKSIP